MVCQKTGVKAVRRSLPARMALVTETWPPEINGVAMTLARLAGGLSSRGVDIQVVRPRQAASTDLGDETLQHVLVPGLPIPGYAGLRFGLPALRRLHRQWSRQRPQVVHIATEGPLGWAAMHVARKLDIPVTTSFHTNFHTYCRHYGLGWLHWLVNGYLRGFHNRALCTLAPSEPCARSLERDGYRNIGVLGRGIDTQLFNPAKRSEELRRHWGVAPDDLVAIYVGRMAPEKNLPIAVQAFAALRKEAPGARMVWVGDGPDLNKLRRKHSDHVFVGSKTGEELAAYYASADVFVFPSLSETFGNVVLEAMASGLAVVAYRYAAAEMHVRHQITGLTAPFGNTLAFCELAIALGKQPELARRLGERASREVAHLGWQAVLDQFAERLALAASHATGDT